MSKERIQISEALYDIMPSDYQDLVKSATYGKEDRGWKDIGTSKELIEQHSLCAGCPESMAFRYILASLPNPEDTVMVGSTGCTSLVFPMVAVHNIHSLFGNTAAVATGIAAALKVRGRSEVRVVAQGGDGGTTDIGFGCLSGMFERNDDVLYICYDNGGYMNTGIQRSSATPPAARTATTLAVGDEPGNLFGQGKFVPAIAMAHEIPYVATATVADLRDLEAKVRRAMAIRGARYLHILVPCPLGWGTASHETIRIARLAKETGIFPVFEAEYGEVKSVLPIRRPLPVEEYLKPQKRYAHLFGAHPKVDVIARLQVLADRNIRKYGLLDEGAR